MLSHDAAAAAIAECGEQGEATSVTVLLRFLLHVVRTLLRLVVHTLTLSVRSRSVFWVRLLWTVRLMSSGGARCPGWWLRAMRS